jgi:hypothetical protein
VADSKFGFWFSKIETREQALAVVKHTSYGYFAVAAIQPVGTFLFEYELLWDVAILVTVCIQGPSATGGERHEPDYASPEFSAADR